MSNNVWKLADVLAAQAVADLIDIVSIDEIRENVGKVLPTALVQIVNKSTDKTFVRVLNVAPLDTLALLWGDQKIQERARALGFKEPVVKSDKKLEDFVDVPDDHKRKPKASETAKEQDVPPAPKSNVKCPKDKFLCPDCGPVDSVLFDGGHVREREFEGCWFDATKDAKGKVTVATPDDDYFDDFNMKKLTKEMAEIIEEGDTDVKCGSCGEVFDMDLGEPGPTPVSVPVSKFEDIFGGEVPVHHKISEGNWEVRDAQTGKVMTTYTVPLINGKEMPMQKAFPAKLLKPIKLAGGGTLKKGAKVKVHRFGQSITLVEGSMDHLTLGVDYEFIKAKKSKGRSAGLDIL